jgi:uncharacterized spore protein YtfJ
MTADMQRRIEEEMTGKGDSFVDKLAERIGSRAGTAAVYAEPVERDGVTVIGVARVRWGFGGGGGTGTTKESGEGSGSGGGGGVSVTPMGFIEMKNGAAEYRPIRPQGVEPALSVALIIMASAFAAGMVLGGLRRLLRK